MKKIFTLLAVAMVAFYANAQTAPATYTFDNNSATYQVGENGTATTYNLDGVEGFAVNYTGASSAKMYITLAANENIQFEYGNSSTKNNAFKTSPTFAQCDSKNFVIIVKNLKADDVVRIEYTAKGGTDATMTNAGNSNTQVEKDAVATTGKETKAIYAVKAVANGSIKIKETAAGFRIYRISINEDLEVAGINTVRATETKTVKKIDNGNVVIENNGVSYNILGQPIK